VRSAPRPLANAAIVLVASLAFATSSPLARVATGLTPIGVAAGRVAVASLAIFLTMPLACMRAWAALSRRQLAALVLAGLVLGAHFALFLVGLATTSFPAAVALVSLEPLAVVLSAWAAFGLGPTRIEAAGILLATLGALVVSRGAGHGEHRLLGDMLVTGAVVLYGVYVSVARGLRAAMPGLPYAGSVYGIATLALLPFALYLDARHIPPPAGTIAAVVALGLVPTLIGHTVVQLASRRAPPTIVALVSPGETLGSLAIGMIALGAFPSAVEGAGAALILAGATMAILRAPASVQSPVAPDT
jgi:drug/metabolite transporter (DMT)-like permease